MIFAWLSRISWTFDSDDLPGWPPEPEPAAVVEPAVYPTDLPHMIGERYGNGRVWSSVLRQIERRGPVEPWTPSGRREDVA